MRTPLIAGNWKMNPTSLADAERLALQCREAADRHHGVVTVICPPTIWLADVRRAAGGGRLHIGAQTMHFEEKGAFTGETSPVMLHGVAGYVIIGHSERRQYFNDTDDTVNRKLETALERGLTPIVCVGEVLEEREAGLTEDVLRRQCLRAFNGISARKAAKLVIAYEPVWAIGTGKTATPQMAADAHSVIRHEAGKAFGDDFAQNLRILYGGSVKPGNATALMSESEIDGALVGGASLDPPSFAKIVKY